MNEGWGFTAGADKRKHISSLPFFLRRLHSLSVFLTWCFVKTARGETPEPCLRSAVSRSECATLVREPGVRVQVHVRVCLGVWMKGR